MNIVVTGANRGLGLSIASVSATRGHTVYAGVRDTEAGTEALKRLQLQYPNRIYPIPLDVVDETSVAEAVAHVEASVPHVDVLINNAAILLGRSDKLEAVNLEEVRLSFEVNLYGPIRVSKHFVRLLLGSERGVILNITSEAGSLTNAYAGDYPYAVSKAALNSLSEKQHAELKDRGIYVYAVHPGWMQTDMGGPQAPMNSMDSAEGIVRIAEMRLAVDAPFRFVDYNGNPMAI